MSPTVFISDLALSSSPGLTLFLLLFNRSLICRRMKSFVDVTWARMWCCCSSSICRTSNTVHNFTSSAKLHVTYTDIYVCRIVSMYSNIRTIHVQCSFVCCMSASSSVSVIDKTHSTTVRLYVYTIVCWSM